MSKCCPKCGSSAYVVVHGTYTRRGSINQSQESTTLRGATIAGATIGTIVPGIGNIVGGIVGYIGGHVINHLSKPTYEENVYLCKRCDHKFS